MRSVFAALLTVVVLSAGTACAQSDGDSLDWDPARRDFRKPGGTPPSGEIGGGAMAGLDKELARTDLAPQNRANLLVLRSMLFRSVGRESASRRDFQEALRVWPDIRFRILAATAMVDANAGRTQPAIDQLDKALQERPGQPTLLTARAQVRLMLGDNDLAIADLSSLVDGSPHARWLRVQAYYNKGSHRESSDDIEALMRDWSGAAPVLPMLWRFANNVKLRRDARRALAADYRAHGEPAEWPAPIVRHLLGRMSAGDLDVAAETDAGARRTNGRCLSALFQGLDALRGGNRNRARELFRLSQARCGPNSSANLAAAAELGRM
ncbi:MAG: tetratricopeptide repeat protein [Alphaproteobacteria bacterium]|nr:tetratricopeptide repeat protein [Alphaproteobacteria bacterium]MCW5743429.1 tetratricopeptide repeat protein [Alphaproteobacteria bacterium]